MKCMYPNICNGVLTLATGLDCIAHTLDVHYIKYWAICLHMQMDFNDILTCRV